MGSVGLLLSLVFSTRAGLPLLLEVDLHLALLCPPLLLLELAFVITVYGVDNWARQANRLFCWFRSVWISSSSFISSIFFPFFQVFFLPFHSHPLIHYLPHSSYSVQEPD